jgi:hypothetical protein
MKLICGLHSCPHHCLQCQWLLRNLSCQPLQRCCPGSCPHDPPQYSHRRGLGVQCVRPGKNNRVIMHIQRSVRSRPWRRQGCANTSGGHAGCSRNAWRCSGDKAAGVAGAIIAAFACIAAVSRSQEADWGADTQAETRCCTSPPSAQEAATSLCLCCLAKCDWPGRRCSAAQRCTCRHAAPGTDMCIK